MAIDPNIALQAGTGAAAPPNPFAMVGQAVGIANAMGQNKLLGVQTDTAQQGRSQDAKMWIAQQSLSLYAKATKDPGAAWHDLGQVLKSGVATGRISQNDADQADKYFSGFKTPGELAPAFLRHAMGSLGVTEQINAEAPGITMVGTGGSTVPVGTPSSVDRAFRGAQPPGAIVSTQTPSEQLSYVETPVLGKDGLPERLNGVLTGRKEQLTGAAAAQRAGLGHLAPGAARPPAVVPPGGTSFNVGNGRPVAQTTASTPGIGGAAPSAAERDATAAAVQTGTAAGARLIADADAVPAANAVLGEMATLLRKFPTGKGSAEALNVQAMIQGVGGDRIAKVFGIDPTKIAAGEKFSKLANGLLLQQANAIGAGTDASRVMMGAASPGMGLSTMTNMQIVQLMQGNGDAVSDKARAWSNSPEFGTGSYSRFSVRWNEGYDPRSYQIKYMSEDERQSMLKNMGAEDKKRFLEKYTAFVKAGGR